MTYTALSVSKRDQFAQTPEWLKAHLRRSVGRYFDPCPASPRFDGLAVPWRKVNYVNPPYEDVSLWMAKAVREWTAHGRVSLFLIPFRMHTRYIREAAPHISRWILLRRPPAFQGYKSRPPFAVYMPIVGQLPGGLRTDFKRGFYMLRARTMQDLAAKLRRTYACRVHSVGRGASARLSDVLDAVNRGGARCAAIAPARLNNAAVRRALAACNHAVFCNPTLHGTTGKYIEGTVAFVFHAAPPKGETVRTLEVADWEI